MVLLYMDALDKNHLEHSRWSRDTSLARSQESWDFLCSLRQARNTIFIKCNPGNHFYLWDVDCASFR